MVRARAIFSFTALSLATAGACALQACGRPESPMNLPTPTTSEPSAAPSESATLPAPSASTSTTPSASAVATPPPEPSASASAEPSFSVSVEPPRAKKDGHRSTTIPNVGATMDRAIPSLKQCQVRALADDPNMSGSAVFSVSVAANGRVDRVGVASNEGVPPKVIACVVGVLEKLHFDAPGSATTLSVPLRFGQNR